MSLEGQQPIQNKALTLFTITTLGQSSPSKIFHVPIASFITQTTVSYRAHFQSVRNGKDQNAPGTRAIVVGPETKSQPAESLPEYSAPSNIPFMCHEFSRVFKTSQAENIGASVISCIGSRILYSGRPA